MKTLWITNIPSPYRVDFFNELSTYTDIMVLFERFNSTKRNKKWKSEGKFKFQHTFLKGIKMSSDHLVSLGFLKEIKKDYQYVFILNAMSITGMLSILYAAFKKKKIVIEGDGAFIYKESFLKYHIKRYIYKKAQYYFSTGKNHSDYYKNYGVNSNLIFQYPFSSINEKELSVKKDKFEINQIKNTLGIIESKILLFVGQLIHRKGIDILLKAFNKVKTKDVRLIIIGGYLNQAQLDLVDTDKRALISDLGFKSKEELNDYYSVSDVFVFPTREDIWGLVINEAMAHSLPIISTIKCGSALELVDNDNGVLLEAENHVSFQEAIDDMLNNEDYLKFMSINSYKKIQNYTIEEMVKAHLSFLDDSL